MSSLKRMTPIGTALIIAAALSLGAFNASADDTAAPATEAAQPEAPATAAEPSNAETQAPGEAAAAPQETEAPEAAATQDAPAQQPAPHAMTNIDAQDLRIGTPVFATDGIKIGEVNRVTSGPEGKVSEIQITTGGPAGINADTIEISADKILSLDDGVKLSLSSEEAKSLPVNDNGNG